MISGNVCALRLTCWMSTGWSPSLGFTLVSLPPRIITHNGRNQCHMPLYLLPTVPMHIKQHQIEHRCPPSHVPPLAVPQQPPKSPSSPLLKKTSQTKRARRREPSRRSPSLGQKRGTKVMARWIATSDSHRRLKIHLPRP